MKQITLFDLEAFTTPSPLSPATYDPAWDIDESQPQCKSVGEQVTPVTSESTNTNNLVNFHTKKSAPQHDNHWVEKYWVERSGTKYWYYRYMWMEGRKLHRVYIGSEHSPRAKAKKQSVEFAIADGQTPVEIKQILRGKYD